jgi:hypothetical protein
MSPSIQEYLHADQGGPTLTIKMENNCIFLIKLCVHFKLLLSKVQLYISKNKSQFNHFIKSYNFNNIIVIH